MFMSPKLPNTILWILDNVGWCINQHWVTGSLISNFPRHTSSFSYLVTRTGICYSAIGWLLKIQNIYLINQPRCIQAEFTSRYIFFMWFQFWFYSESRWLEHASDYVIKSFWCIIMNTRQCQMMFGPTIPTHFYCFITQIYQVWNQFSQVIHLSCWLDKPRKHLCGLGTLLSVIHRLINGPHIIPCCPKCIIIHQNVF